VLRRRVAGINAVIIYVMDMVPVLGHLIAVCKLGQEEREQPGLAQVLDADGRLVGFEKLHELVAYTFL